MQNWTVDDVQNGRALIESRSGGVYDVAIGRILPSIGMAGGLC